MTNPQNSVITRTMICGATAGVVAKTCIAPFERVKISFQVSEDRFTWSFFLDRLKKMFQSDGFIGLWKGHSMTVLRVAPYASFSYTLHDTAENIIKKYKLKQGSTSTSLSPVIKFFLGSFSGAGATLLTYPLDVLRVKLAMRLTLQEAIKERGFYNGLSPTLLGIIPYSGTAWLIKQSLLEQYNKRHRNIDKIKNSKAELPSVHLLLVFNGIAGLTGQFFTYPLDILRRKMQLAHYQDGKKSHSIKEVTLEILKREGIRGFSKGFSINLIKGPLALSISFTVFDYLKHLFIIEEFT